jgi:L-rhamnose mutarotase
VQRVAFRLRVRPERLAEYKQLHQEVWPKLLDDMRAASIRNYSIFADGPELFGYLECDDWDAASEALARSDANRRWQELMSAYLATPVDRTPPHHSACWRKCSGWTEDAVAERRLDGKDDQRLIADSR